MDKVLDKLGIYDLLGVLLSGLIISTFTIVIFIFLNWNLKIQITDSFQFLIISYFVGLVFQELGSKLNCWKILKSVFKTSNDLHICLSRKEINFFMTTMYEKLNLSLSDDNSIVEIYNYCKLFLNDSDKTKQDRKKSLSGMARSLSVYFCFLFVFLLVVSFIKLDKMYFILAIVALVFLYLFYNRYVRFMKMKYVYVLRKYFYDNNNK